MSQGIDLATKYFESLFEKVLDHSTADGDKLVPVMYSGGVCSHDAIAPALFSSPERAIESWVNQATSSVLVFDTLEWIYKPELLSYQITMADAKQRHRVVSNRYCIKSQFITRKS